jgi:hypothetical protein
LSRTLEAFLLQLQEADLHFVIGDRLGVDDRHEVVSRLGRGLDARQRAELAHAGGGDRRKHRRLVDHRDRRAGGRRGRRRRGLREAGRSTEDEDEGGGDQGQESGLQAISHCEFGVTAVVPGSLRKG